MVKSTGASVRIGMTKRPDNFTRKEVVGLPGPGQHSTGDLTFGKGVKGLAKIKSAKMKPVRNDNPGPGQYTNDENKVKPTRSTAGKIGTTQRPDIWADSIKVARENPSPGNYGDRPAFGKGVKGVANMGSKHKPTRNDNPGPG